MMILHISKRRIAVMAVSFMVIAAVTVVLAGCFSDKENTITLADTAEMADYLQQLGWQVEPDPIETLDLQLPQTLGDTWGDYAAMQAEQGFPFTDFAGQPIRRYTFRITNYPGMDGGVQANLYLCGDTLIGGDVVATGKGGFQHGLALYLRMAVVRRVPVNLAQALFRVCPLRPVRKALAKVVR